MSTVRRSAGDAPQLQRPPRSIRACATAPQHRQRPAHPLLDQTLGALRIKPHKVTPVLASFFYTHFWSNQSRGFEPYEAWCGAELFSNKGILWVAFKELRTVVISTHMQVRADQPRRADLCVVFGLTSRAFWLTDVAMSLAYTVYRRGMILSGAS